MIGCHRLWLVTGRLWLVTGRLWHFVTGRLLVKTHNNDDGDFQSWCWPKASNSMIWWLPITQNHSNLSKASLPQLLLAGFSIHQRHNHLLLNRCVPGFVFIFRFVLYFHFFGSLYLYLHFYLHSDDDASPSLVTKGIFSITSSDAEISSFKVGARARQADWGDVLCPEGGVTILWSDFTKNLSFYEGWLSRQIGAMCSALVVEYLPSQQYEMIFNR